MMSKMGFAQTLILFYLSLLLPIFAQSSTCGGRFTTSTGRITTPNYPGSYPTDTTCKWVIVVSTDSIVELKFTDFSTESYDKNCDDSDVVQIFDGDSELSPVLHSRLCGNHIPRDFVSTGNAMTVVFKSTEDTFSDKGFDATYSTKSASLKQCVINQCGGEIDLANSCALKSPGYPVGYAANQNCSWTLNAPEGATIQVQFQELMLDTLSSKCSKNNVTLFDGSTSQSPIIYERVCDMENNNLDGRDPVIFKTTGSIMLIQFRTSKSSNTSTGFFADISIVLPNTVSPPAASTVASTTSMTSITTPKPSTTTTLYKVITSKKPAAKSTTKQASVTSRAFEETVVGRKTTKGIVENPKPITESSETRTTSTEKPDVPIASNPAAVSGLVIGGIIGLVVIVFGILLIVAFVHWKRQNHRFNIRLREEDAQSDVNTLISNTDSRETVYKGKKYGKIVKIPAAEEFPL